jgi:hypothetical protein
MDTIKKQWLSRNTVSLALDGWIPTNKPARTLVIAYTMDQHLALQNVQLTLNNIDHVFFLFFKS